MRKSTRTIAKNLKKLCETSETTTTISTSTSTSLDYKPVVIESMRKFYKSTVFAM